MIVVVEVTSDRMYDQPNYSSDHETFADEISSSITASCLHQQFLHRSGRF